MKPDEIRIAVVGAGIAGLTLAAALARVGLRCTVFEQARQLRELGAGIQLSPNAVRPLQRLGLAEHLARAGIRPAAVDMRRWDDGSSLVRTPLGELCVDTYDAPYYCLHRADLHQGLVNLVPPDTVRLGLRVVEVEEDASGVRLHFDTGLTGEFDAVVGADGIRSVLRSTLVGDQPRFSGQVVYRGVAPAKRLPHLLREPKVLIWLGPGQHCVCYPISGGDAISFVATTPGELTQGESWTAPGSVEELVSSYTAWHDDVWGVLTAADEVTRWALHDRDPVGTWSTGRLTLLGDAAHPMLPFGAQGAAQAIEDAVALAACLAAMPDVVTAFHHYEQVRRERTDLVQRTMRENARNHHFDDGEQQRERDRTMGDRWSLDGLAWLYGYDAESAAVL